MLKKIFIFSLSSSLTDNLDFNKVIQQESQFGKNLVPKTYSDNWKNTTPGQYNVEVDSGWVDSSELAVKYAMDPRNFLNEVRIFQFETLSYNSSANNINSIEKILYGTEFYQNKVSYLDNKGNMINTNETYSELILRGGQKSAVSTYHLASRIKQEVGPFLSHSSISGNVSGYEGLYNFYNIGATSSAEPMGAIKNGLQFAKDGKGASQATKNKYLIPWNNKEKAISGGGIFIGSSYIQVGQNTVYLQKFDVNDDRGSNLFSHQYMTNVLAPYNEAKSIYKGYQKNGILDLQISFIIPIFNNMPDIQYESPNINSNNYVADNTKVYCNATNVNLRTGPSTSYEVITMLSKDAKMTRIAKSISNGERWDRVQLENGMVGYIFQTYVTEMPAYNKVTGINIDKEELYIPIGENFKINAYIEPANANNTKINFKSDDEKIATIDENGVITAQKEGETIIYAISEENENIKAKCKITVVRKMQEAEVQFTAPLILNNLDVSGIDYTQNTVGDIKNNIISNLEIVIVNSNNEILSDDAIIGTGNKIQVKEDGKILKEYQIILYGDVNGDGKINSVDLLVLQRHILEIETLDDIYQKSANIRKNGNKPSSIDLLLIQRHILGLQIIKQQF